MLVKYTNRIPIEAVVRGYLYGSGWQEYKEISSVCGIKLKKGLRKAEKLPEPIFTPATKADTGHDINIDHKQASELIGKELFEKIKTKSIEIYNKCTSYAEKKGIIIADTKFEFGIYSDELILIDELLTPDSARFWPKDKYKVGSDVPSFDKQFVRDYLESINWDKIAPAPHLPEEVINKTSQKYIEAYERIIGKKYIGGE